MRELRLLNSVREHNVTELPIQFRGTIPECEGFANRLGYRWRHHRNNLFGGYFVHPDNGNCLFIT